MEKVRTTVNLGKMLENYKLDKKVTIGNKLQIQQDNIIIPKNFQYLPSNIVMGAIFLFAEFKEIKSIKEFSNILLENEIKQISTIYSFINIYSTTETSFILDKKGKIKQFLSFFQERINKTGSLWNFIKELLENIDFYQDKSLDEVIEDYIEYKASYEEAIENDEYGENELDDINRDEYYKRQDMSEQESMPGEDNGVIAVMDTIVNERYFAEFTKEVWSKSHLHFGISDKEKTQIYPEQFTSSIGNYSFFVKKGKSYCLPLDKKLKLIDWDTQEVKIFQDKYGHLYVKALVNGTIDISVGYNVEKNDFATDEVEKSIYSGNKIDSKNWNSPDDIQSWIRQEKEYSVEFQKKLEEDSNGDTNKYLELIYEAKAFECDSANIFFVAMCREIGYQARLIHGYSVYKKEGQTYVSKNRGHAWSEVYIDGKWKLYDATPIRGNDDNEKNNETEEMGDVIEEILDQEQVWEGDDIELTETKKEVSKNILTDLEMIDNPYFESAVDFVEDDARDIINYIKNILKQRENELKKRKLRGVPKSKKSGLSSGDLKINSYTIEKLAVGNPNVFERKRKLKAHLMEDIDTKLKDVSFAIDVSGSMGGVTGEWERGTKADYTYLSLVLIYLVAKELDINIGTVALFSSKVQKGSIEEILRNFNNLLGGDNDANTEGIKEALKNIRNSEKGVCFVISDGDGENGTAFFDGETRDILRKNKQLAIVGYGIGEDAVKKLPGKIDGGYIPTVIEFRMQESKNYKQSKGYNIKEYENIVGEFRKGLSRFMTQSNMEL